MTSLSFEGRPELHFTDPLAAQLAMESLAFVLTREFPDVAFGVDGIEPALRLYDKFVSTPKQAGVLIDTDETTALATALDELEKQTLWDEELSGKSRLNAAETAMLQVMRFALPSWEDNAWSEADFGVE